MSTEDTTKPEDKVGAAKAATDVVMPFPGFPWRYTAEMVIRSLLSQIDKVEDVVVVFRLQGKNSLLMNYNSEMSAVDLLVASATTRSLAEQKMGISPPFQLPQVEKGPFGPEGA